MDWPGPGTNKLELCVLHHAIQDFVRSSRKSIVRDYGIAFFIPLSVLSSFPAL